MFITRRNPFTGQSKTRCLPITLEELMRYESGELVQNVWPHLSDDDREFILTGIDDWDKYIPIELPQEEIVEAQKNSGEVLVGDLDNLLIASVSSQETPEKASSPPWTPPSKKVYQTINFAAYKIKQLRPIFPYLSPDVILAGGSLRTVLNCAAEKVSDFDLFFKTFQGVTALREKLLSAGWTNTFSCPEEKLFSYKKGQNKIQLICEREYFSPQELIESFDITACVCAYHEGIIFFTREFVRSVFRKQARIQNVTFPVATIKRIVKYSHKGYSVSQASEDFVRLTNGIVVDESGFRHYID